MKKYRLLSVLLVLITLLTILPAHAAQRTEMPDYFGLSFDGEQIPTLTHFTAVYGKDEETLNSSVTVADSFYYAIEKGVEFTVTNRNPSSTGFVYICCDVAGSQSANGGYLVDVDQDCYYLGADGRWKLDIDGASTLGQVMGRVGQNEGTMLSYGKSCTFTLPRMDDQAAYVLYLYYYDPACTGLADGYTEYQRNVYRYALSGGTGFTDVPEDAYYAKAVEWALEEGVTNGTGETTFSPNATVTRGQAVTFLWRASGRPEPAAGAPVFADTSDPAAYYYSAVRWAAQEGITDGVSAACFDPDGTLLYEQVLAFLCRAAGGDAVGNDWSQKALAWAEDNGLTDGLTFVPTAQCPRSDTIYLLWQQLGDQEDGQQPEQEDPEQEQPEQEKPVQEEQGGAHTQTNPAPSSQLAAEVERVVDQVVTPGMSDYEIAKALHDYVVLNCDYDTRYYSGNMPYISYTPEGMLLEGTAVCAGYGQAYQLLMEEAGIPCEYITGYAGGYHAWNLVLIDGQWYHVDTTWDDPTNRGGDYIRYDYFLKSDAYMRRNSHTSWTADRVCTSTKYDGLDLPDGEQEALEQYAAIRQIVEDAIAQLPYQTEAEQKAASEDELFNARYAYVTMDASYPNLILQEAYQVMADDLRAKYPNLSIYYDNKCHGYEIYRKDIAAAAEALRQEQQAQQEALEADHAKEIQKILEEAIAGGDAYSYQISLSGYTKKEIQKACAAMKADGYRFGDYTSDDYSLSAQFSSVIITNLRWKEEQIQAAVDVIAAAIDAGESEVVINITTADGRTESAYVRAAAERIAATGYVTPGGLASGVDFVITTSLGYVTYEQTNFKVKVEYLGDRGLSLAG